MPLETTTVTTITRTPLWFRGRRVRRGSALVLGSLLLVLPGAQASAQTPDTCRELVLYGGKIATMDARTTTASSVVIRDDRIVAVSTSAGIPPHSPCARVINLRGRLVIPGMIDTHDHVSYFTARPGYDVRLDSAGSIADVQRMIRARAASIDKGAWVTSLGGWSPAHLAEKRMPTSAELDVGCARPSGTADRCRPGHDQRARPDVAHRAPGRSRR